MQTRFFLSDGRSIYAPYLSDAERLELKKELEEKRVSLYCGCSKDNPLYYGISSDLRFIPLHKYYEHKTWCTRYDSVNRSSAAVHGDDGTVTLFVSFKAHTFTMSSKKTAEEDLEEPGSGDGGSVIAEKEEGKEEDKEEKEKKDNLPSYNLYDMIRFLNHDTYMNRVASGKYAYLSEDYFNAAFNSYIKFVRISGMKKTLKELSFQEDKMKFFYAKVESFTDKGIVYPGYDGRTIKRFVPERVMAKAEEAFEKKYGISVSECMHICPVMAAGFQYERLNRFGSAFKCVGRMVFFPVNDYCLFADSLEERDIVNVLMKVCKKHNCVFLYSEEDKESYVGIIRNNKTGKEAPVFFNRKAKGYEGDFFTCRGKVPCEEELEAFLPALA